MSEIRKTGPDDGEVALSGPVSLRILEDGSTAAHRLRIAEIVIAPHTEGPPQHRHGEHDEGFYVVSGTVRFTSGDTCSDAPARTLVMVPPGTPHSFANPGDEPAVVLNTFTPDLYAAIESVSRARRRWPGKDHDRVMQSCRHSGGHDLGFGSGRPGGGCTLWVRGDSAGGNVKGPAWP